MLKNNGYNVKVINLLEMDKSDCYNPFSYIREETDVVKLITNLISNTTPKGATPSDPFWEKAEGLFLQSIFYYVWLEVQPAKRNFETVLKLLGEAEVTEQGKASKLDVRMKFLEESSPLGANHPAVKQYNKNSTTRDEPTATKTGSIPSMTAQGPPPLKLTGDCPSIAKTRDI